ncbi:MAG: Trm112 family protein [Gemmatimonadota bacterium]
MHILLTDLLTCPRCGPAFGLIVLADSFDERRVVEGRLGCANCRESFPIDRGVADLRHPTSAALEGSRDFEGDADRAFRAAALLGTTTSGATVLVVERSGSAPSLVSDVLSEVHVVGVSADIPAESGAGVGVLSPLVAGRRLPLRDGSMRGVALLGTASDDLVAESARVLMPGARLVVDPAADDLSERLRGLGFTIHLEQEGVVVAAAPGLG